MNEEYFKPERKVLWLSQSDIDIIVYAINNVDWSKYDGKNFGGEGVEAACIHLDELELQLTNEE